MSIIRIIRSAFDRIYPFSALRQEPEPVFNRGNYGFGNLPGAVDMVMTPGFSSKIHTPESLERIKNITDYIKICFVELSDIDLVERIDYDMVSDEYNIIVNYVYVNDYDSYRKSMIFSKSTIDEMVLESLDKLKIEHNADFIISFFRPGQTHGFTHNDKIIIKFRAEI